MSDVSGRRPSGGWRRRGAGLAVLAVVLGAGVLWMRRPVDVDLELALGASPPRVVEVIVSDSRDQVVADLLLRYGAGLAPGARHHLRLRPGDYAVAARLEYAPPQPERDLTRSLHVEQAGTYSIDLSD